MHIPDGLLSVSVAAVSTALAVPAVGIAAAKARQSARAVAMLGVTAAFVFAAQMVNFPVAGGTSGHLLGGVLAAVLVGPSSAVIIMTAVLVLQCLVFGDGGILALGANVLNMAVIHPLVGFAIYRALGGSTPARKLAALAFGGWVATLVAAATCAGELALSGIASSAIVFSTMVGAHLLVGVGEAVISALVLALVLRQRPELVRAPSRGSLAFGLVVALALALFVSPFACSWPDGLEHTVAKLGIEPANARIGPLREWAAIGGLRTSLAAAFGTLFVFGLCFALGHVLSQRRS